MSVTSGTTLISPSAATAHHATQHVIRRNSSHLTHPSHAHHPKRRGTAHAHHAANAGPSRRLSDGESGRRAVTSGLTMHALDQQPKNKRKTSNDRPLTKATRSDTHLPRLSRTTSQTSNTSEGRHGVVARPKKDRRRRGESVQVLSESGIEADSAGSAEEGWESGEGDVTPAKGMGRDDDLRRTISDPQPETVKTSEVLQRNGNSDVGVSPGALPDEQDHPHPQTTRKTTGFSGSVQTLAPQMALHAHLNGNTPHYNDLTHIMPAHQLKYQQSARSLAARSLTEENASPLPIEGKPSGPAGLPRVRSTHSGDLRDPDPGSSPTFPFPPVKSALSESTLPISKQPTPPRVRQVSGGEPSKSRSRLASGNEPPRLRQRTSNSSLRSMQSMRAPPHPLNSPTGYRSGMAPVVGTSQGGVAFTSPPKRDRGPSMHHPPIAPPMVYREVVSGQVADSSYDQSTSHVSQVRAPDTGARKSSVSSARSLRGILGGGSSGHLDHAASESSAIAHPQPARRQTALEVATAMSKRHSTTDAALYHQSLGYPSSSAETAYLISRFLPQKRIRRPAWEISPADIREGHSGIGLTSGDYREAHESLIRVMRDLTVGNSGRRTTSRSYSYQTLMGSSSTDLGSQEGVGTLKGRNGPLVVARGGWRGRTPFELSVERCLAQRPKNTIPGLRE